MEDEERIGNTMEGPKREDNHRVNGLRIKRERGRSSTSTPNGSKDDSRSPSLSLDEIKVSSDSASTPDTNSAPKLSRKASQKMNSSRAPRLFDQLPDVTRESYNHFQLIPDCLYGSKHMGSSEHDALDCDCTEEWNDGQNHACGEDSDCINRATKMECVDGDCNCGSGCQNQRFQRKQYANVSVIKTEKKGFGLRANTDLQPNDFIFEYIGEVINEPTFRRRMVQYDDEGIKHFYFMSLTKHEFVDATKKGNLGRFCNHSCNPNCYVDKWVVGEKLRMGIFAGRHIRAGEELVFNYNVDRYGADPQPCYCGEANCTGFIGGKTQTERATKLSVATIEALGIDDGDNWDTAVAKKPRKKKPTEDDEEYVNSVQPRGLDEEGVTKVMAALMQCKEKWIGVKLLARIQDAEDERVLHRVVRMHGYQILATALNTFLDDDNVVLQILDILYKFPRLTKNKISDSKIESMIEGLTSSEHENVASNARRLLDEWSKLEVAYRIPRKKVDPAAPAATTAANSSFEERRGIGREEEAATSQKPPSPFHNVVIPKGPRSNIPQRNANYYNGQRPRRPPQNHNLPAGWFAAMDPRGNVYYYNKSGAVTWQRPTAPADKSAPGLARAPSRTQKDKDAAVQEIIDSLTRETPRPSASHTPQGPVTPVQEPKKEKWRYLPVEKQMKIYENTISPHVKYIMDKFRKRLPREELKKFAKDIGKKLVASDYKNNRVENPTMLSSRQEKKIKAFVKDFFERAAQKYDEAERKKAERAARHAADEAGRDTDELPTTNGETTLSKQGIIDGEDLPALDDTSSPISPDRKRKREEQEDEEEGQSPSLSPSETPSVKRLKEDEADVPTPPPPPPPPPEAAMEAADMTEEEKCMREQEEALMRENEEAQRLEDEAATRDKMREEAEDAKTLRDENEVAPRDFAEDQHMLDITEDQGVVSNSTVTAPKGIISMVSGGSSGGLDGGNGVVALDLDADVDGASTLARESKHQKTEVLGH